MVRATSRGGQRSPYRVEPIQSGAHAEWISGMGCKVPTVLWRDKGLGRVRVRNR